MEAFNTLLKSFLGELTRVFPEQKRIQIYLRCFDDVTRTAPGLPHESFMEALVPLEALVASRDPTLFQKLSFAGIDFYAMWTSPGITDATQDAIWQYIEQLFALGQAAKEQIEPKGEQTGPLDGPPGFDLEALGSLGTGQGLEQLLGSLPEDVQQNLEAMATSITRHIQSGAIDLSAIGTLLGSGLLGSGLLGSGPPGQEAKGRKRGH